MSLILALVIVILLIVATLLIVIFMPNSNCVFDVGDVPGNWPLFTKEHEKIKEECKGDKNIVLFAKNTFNESVNIHKYPLLYPLLLQLPNIKRIVIASLDPKLNEPMHTGKKFDNTSIRCVFPLEVSEMKKTGIVIDGIIKMFEEGTWILYDNSRIHSMFNKNKKRSTKLLVIDVNRPENIPIGIATDEKKCDNKDVNKDVNKDANKSTNKSTNKDASKT